MINERKEELLKERYELKKDLVYFTNLESNLVLTLPKGPIALYNDKALKPVCVSYMQSRIKEIDKELGI